MTLTRRQRQVMRDLCAVPGRSLELTDLRTYVMTEAHGAPTNEGRRFVQSATAQGLRDEGLLDKFGACLQPTPKALALFDKVGAS